VALLHPHKGSQGQQMHPKDEVNVILRFIVLRAVIWYQYQRNRVIVKFDLVDPLPPTTSDLGIQEQCSDWLFCS